MARVVVVTSGKGGVGKTTTSASIATGLAMKGKKTLVIDFDIGLRNLDLIMGCENRVIYDFVNVINNESSFGAALVRDKVYKNLSTLAASQTRDKNALTKEGVGRVLAMAKDHGFEYIICDSPAGIEEGALHALYYADQAIVVTNPEVSSVRDSDRILGVLAAKSKRAEEDLEPVEQCLLLTRYNPARVESGEMLSLDDVNEILKLPVIGVIPDSESVLNASNKGVPVIHDQKTDAAMAYMDAVERILGEDVKLRFVDGTSKGFFGRLFGRKS
ncbi:septum site-determining protein MinD [Photobacterium leiognathi]|uniref:septum site-determining protein MinD n=1 Tax=Photobacterium leiognathi TaxID=553611 RepID=UPI001EDED7BE|nr:septum site-determining protein MinD [Photobacterium leiognathi]MCG3883706.1 septum site-determining protein MinD [Photobacterium leiognathi]